MLIKDFLGREIVPPIMQFEKRVEHTQELKNRQNRAKKKLT